MSSKGPVPSGFFGQLPPSSSKRRCTIEQVCAYSCSGSEHTGRDRCRRNLSSSIFSNAVIEAKVVRLADCDRGSIQRLMLKATSSTVNLSPFDQRTPGCNAKSQVLRSKEGFQLCARYG